MRIITGKAKGCGLVAPAGEDTRPTLAQVKEAVFSMIQFDLAEKEVLDLFAGSGQLGLEALSRGAAHATFVDSAKTAIRAVEANAAKTRLADACTIVRASWSDFLRMRGGHVKYDFIFLDPPYADKCLPAVLRALQKNSVLRPTSLIICESAAPEDIWGGDTNLSAQYTVRRQNRYGQVYITLLEPCADIETGAEYTGETVL